MRHDRAKSSCFEFIGVEKECYEMERAINKTETKREENKRSGKREKKDEWKERWKAFQRTTQHLSRKISRLALTLHICFSFIANISKNVRRERAWNHGNRKSSISSYFIAFVNIVVGRIVGWIVEATRPSLFLSPSLPHVGRREGRAGSRVSGAEVLAPYRRTTNSSMGRQWKTVALLPLRPSSTSRGCAVITAACGRKHVGTCGRGASSRPNVLACSWPS